MTIDTGEDAARAHLKAYATERAAKAWLALHPTPSSTGREKAVMMIAGFSEATEETAARLLARYPGATDAALECDDRREAICSAVVQSLAPVTVVEQ